MSGSSVRKLTFGGGLTPKSAESTDEGILYLDANRIQNDVRSGISYELDMSDGYGEFYEEIASITDAAKPNEGMLAFNTKQGATIYFLPGEFVDVRLKEEVAA